MKNDPERARLEQDTKRKVYWKRWGPYLSERQWGTVREDYSADGSAWEYFPHDHARSRAYRWGEDGLAGVSDTHQRLCLALALWNGHDPFLKERLFGLSNHEGNHGEDVKESYFYIDNTPTHSWMRWQYRYPQAAFPYKELLEQNARRGRDLPEFELEDTEAFAEGRYFDVAVDYAKASPEDLLMRVRVFNRGPQAAVLHVLPTLWFRNTWSWGDGTRPSLRQAAGSDAVIEAEHPDLGRRRLYCESPRELLFTENETNFKKLYGVENLTPYVKDAFHERVIDDRAEAVNPARQGTKAAAWHVLNLAPGAGAVVRLRLSDSVKPLRAFDDFAAIMDKRKSEADAFYANVSGGSLSEADARLQRAALSGLLWNKQSYRYDVARWLSGDPGQPPPPPGHAAGRNRTWIHLDADEVLSMPDKWEYPWFASWDLAFHTVPLALVDSEFAKRQLLQLTREWFMHPNGQLPAYEWDFSDVNPPVQPWAALRLYHIERRLRGRGDRLFLERVFQKLLLNFTWWVNREDATGSNVFEGGFLGLDNIGVFDRDAPLPGGGLIEQADGTSWMAAYSLNMLAIALELAAKDPAYEDIASKFFEHFLRIADAVNHLGGSERGLWDEQDGFYYDALRLPDGRQEPLRVRSAVGLTPLFAVHALEKETLERFPDFRARLEWFIANRPDLHRNVASLETRGLHGRLLLSIVDPERLRRILARVLDEGEFLSPFGIRSLSKAHAAHPFVLKTASGERRVDYEPAESRSGMFGGNSNWRGPVWFPLNYLLIEALQRFDFCLGDGFKVECPTGSGRFLHLWDVSQELSRRLLRLFPAAHEPPLFYEYYDGDTGRGLGASHQTGWTALAAKLLQQRGDYGAKSGRRSPARKLRVR